MGSDESGHNESEFYYSEEDNFNQITPRNRDEVEQERHTTPAQILWKTKREGQIEGSPLSSQTGLGS